MERARAYRVHIEWVLRQPGLNGDPISYRAAAHKLNERNIESPTGRCWRGHQIQRIARRLGLDHPPGYLKDDVVRARVRAVWRKHPDCTTEQMVAIAGLEHPLGLRRARVHLKTARMATAKRSAVQKMVGWHVDRWTTTRIRIGEILKRHPEFTGKQVIEHLGPDCAVRLKWVWQVMAEYHWAANRPSRQAQRLGRRFCNLWRSPEVRRELHSAHRKRRASR